MIREKYEGDYTWDASTFVARFATGIEQERMVPSIWLMQTRDGAPFFFESTVQMGGPHYDRSPRPNDPPHVEVFESRDELEEWLQERLEAALAQAWPA